MLFTSTTAPFRTSPSAQFKERGDSNGFPGTCVQTHIFSVSAASKEIWPLYRGMIPQVAIANVSNAPTSPSGLAVWLRQVPILYPSPQVGISFNNPSEATLGAIYSQGFVQDANGRTKYYRGTPKVDQVGSIISLNPNMNTFVPAGVCDLDGFKAFIITSRVLTTVMTAFPTDLTTPILFSSDGTPSISISRDLPGSYKIPAMEEILAGSMPMAYPLNQSSQDFILRAAKDLKASPISEGTFFPYFRGLVLPDKSFVPDFLINEFSALLAEDGPGLEEACQTLWSGWSCLAATESGLQMQHAAYVLKLALQSGTKPVMFRTNGLYSGMILMGSTTFMKRGEKYEPKGLQDLIKELKEYDSHDEVLDEVAAIINTCKIEEYKDVDRFLKSTGAFFGTPRTIHNVLRSLVVDPDQRSELKKLFRKLHFDTKVLDPRNPKELLRVFRVASENAFLGDDDPICINDDAMFTKDSTMSCFAAFGATAPSFFDQSGTALPILRKGKKNVKEFGERILINKRTKSNGDLVLPGGKIPVFIKATQLAIGDFKTMKKSYAIAFRVSPKGGVANASFLVDKGHEDQVAEMLIECFAPPKTSTSKKRTMEMVEDLSAMELKDRAERAAKKAKKNSSGAALWGQVVA